MGEGSNVDRRRFSDINNYNRSGTQRVVCRHDQHTPISTQRVVWPRGIRKRIPALSVDHVITIIIYKWYMLSLLMGCTMWPVHLRVCSVTYVCVV